MSQKVIHPHEGFMDVCVRLARETFDEGNYPIGSIVVDSFGNIVGKGKNELLTEFDPTGHPEILAIREACLSLKTRYLEGAFLYSTLEPCPMCTAAAIWAKMEGIVYGSSQSDAIAFSRKSHSQLFTWRQIELTAKQVVKKGTPMPRLYGNLKREKCNELFLLTLGK